MISKDQRALLESMNAPASTPTAEKSEVVIEGAALISDMRKFGVTEQAIVGAIGNGARVQHARREAHAQPGQPVEWTITLREGRFQDVLTTSTFKHEPVTDTVNESTWMNQYEIERAIDHFNGGDRPNLAKAAKILSNLMNWTNDVSDGWSYWKKPATSAAKLMDLIKDHVHRFSGDISEEELKKACSPIRAFLNRHGSGKDEVFKENAEIIDGAAQILSESTTELPGKARAGLDQFGYFIVREHSEKHEYFLSTESFRQVVYSYAGSLAETNKVIQEVNDRAASVTEGTVEQASAALEEQLGENVAQINYIPSDDRLVVCLNPIGINHRTINDSFDATSKDLRQRGWTLVMKESTVWWASRNLLESSYRDRAFRSGVPYPTAHFLAHATDTILYPHVGKDGDKGNDGGKRKDALKDGGDSIADIMKKQGDDIPSGGDPKNENTEQVVEAKEETEEGVGSAKPIDESKGEKGVCKKCGKPNFLCDCSEKDAAKKKKSKTVTSESSDIDMDKIQDGEPQDGGHSGDVDFDKVQDGTPQVKQTVKVGEDGDLETVTGAAIPKGTYSIIGTNDNTTVMKANGGSRTYVVNNEDLDELTESFGGLEDKINKETLKFAVGRAITCPYSKKILDVSDAVYVDSPGKGSIVMCGAEYEKRKDIVKEKLPDAEIIDGRILFGRGGGKKKAAKPVKTGEGQSDMFEASAETGLPAKEAPGTGSLDVTVQKGVEAPVPGDAGENGLPAKVAPDGGSLDADTKQKMPLDATSYSGDKGLPAKVAPGEGSLGETAETSAVAEANTNETVAETGLPKKEEPGTGSLDTKTPQMDSPKTGDAGEKGLSAKVKPDDGSLETKTPQMDSPATGDAGEKGLPAKVAPGDGSLGESIAKAIAGLSGLRNSVAAFDPENAASLRPLVAMAKQISEVKDVEGSGLKAIAVALKSPVSLVEVAKKDQARFVSMIQAAETELQKALDECGCQDCQKCGTKLEDGKCPNCGGGDGGGEATQKDEASADLAGEIYDALSESGRITNESTLDQVMDSMVEALGQREDVVDFDAERFAEATKKAHELDVPTKHQVKIAKATLRMSDAGANVAGGPNKEESRQILKDKLGWNDEKIKAYEDSDSVKENAEMAEDITDEAVANWKGLMTEGEREDHQAIEDACGGPNKAFALMRLHQRVMDSRSGDRFDAFSRKDKPSPEEQFRKRARQEGYSDEAINLYLKVQ